MYSQSCNVIYNAKCKPDANDIDNITIKKMSGFDTYEIEWAGYFLVQLEKKTN